METIYRALRSQPLRRGPQRLVGGICSGIAVRFGWDPWLVRLITLLLFILPVIGLGLYLVLWLLLPWADNSIPLQRIVSSFSKR